MKKKNFKKKAKANPKIIGIAKNDMKKKDISLEELNEISLDVDFGIEK